LVADVGVTVGQDRMVRVWGSICSGALHGILSGLGFGGGVCEKWGVGGEIGLWSSLFVGFGCVQLAGLQRWAIVCRHLGSSDLQQ